MSGRWTSLGALVALCLAVYLPGLRSLPAVDRDESRFAQASRQMLESLTLPAASLDPVRHSGGWAVPMVQDKPRLNKPPLTYWLQAASAWVCTGGDVLRDDIWMYRIPSVLGAIVAVLGTWKIGRSMFDPRVAWLGAAFLAVCPMVVWDAHQARADELLLGATTWAMAALWAICRRAWRGERVGWASPIGLWVAVAVGVLAKGPITPMVVMLTAIAASVALRRWRWISATRPVLGLAIVAAALAPWLAGVVRHVGWSSYLDTVWAEVIGRSAEAKEGHWGPPGYHLVLLAVLLWPGCLTTLSAVIGTAKSVWVARRAGAGGTSGPEAAHTPGYHANAFLLAWVGPAWLVFELVGTKLPHYTLPLYPALALLSARELVRLESSCAGSRGFRAGLILWALIGVGIVAFVPGVLTWVGLGGQFDAVGWAIIGLLACALVILATSAWRHSRRGPGDTRAMMLAIISMVMMSGVLFTFVLPGPGDRPWWITPKLVRVIAPAGWASSRSLPMERVDAVAACGYQEDSLIFETRGVAERVPPARIGQWMSDHAGQSRAIAILNGDDPEVGRALPPAGWYERSSLRGFNYASGQWVNLRIFAVPSKMWR